jgi:hypothetical protein
MENNLGVAASAESIARAMASVKDELRRICEECHEPSFGEKNCSLAYLTAAKSVIDALRLYGYAVIAIEPDEATLDRMVMEAVEFAFAEGEAGRKSVMRGCYAAIVSAAAQTE